MAVRVNAYAKLNLTLSVTGVRDGYHMLDSLVCSVDLCDEILLKRRDDGNVTVNMHGRGTEDMPVELNNAARAAKLYCNAFGTCGANVTVHKKIPLGAGMGGSSADAAGVLWGMYLLYGLGDDGSLGKLAQALGSDTAYMMRGGYCRLFGRGEIIRQVDYGKQLHFLVLVPPNGVSTAECFRLYDEHPASLPSSNGAQAALAAGDIAALGRQLSNALFAPAARLNPNVLSAYGELKALSPLGVNMTGSGSAVYALFASEEECAAAKAKYTDNFECIQLKSKGELWQKKE